MKPQSKNKRVGGIDWSKIKRVLIVKLRSIGDTVLSTPSLIALKRFAPHVRTDILLEDRVAPLLDGFEHVDNVISVGKGFVERARMALYLGRQGYDIVFNLHGGTTSAFFTASTVARHRFGIATYQYPFLHNHLLSSSAAFWGRKETHSAEQQLAVLGFAGIPVGDLPKTGLAVTSVASAKVDSIISRFTNKPFALVHPASAFESKRWAIDNYARTVDFLAMRGMPVIAVAGPGEAEVLHDLSRRSKAPISAHNDLSLPEITAIASRASLFVGNDSGIAHIAAAVKTPSVVIFGSSNRAHWGPWTDAPHEIVFTQFHCQPCAGYKCAEFAEPRCILSVKEESVYEAISRIMEKAGC